MLGFVNSVNVICPLHHVCFGKTGICFSLSSQKMIFMEVQHGWDSATSFVSILCIPTPTDSCKFVGHVGKPAFVNQNPEMRFRSFL